MTKPLDRLCLRTNGHVRPDCGCAACLAAQRWAAERGLALTHPDAFNPPDFGSTVFYRGPLPAERFAIAALGFGMLLYLLACLVFGV